MLRTGDESAVSIRAIADAVGVTAPSIYLHFADKTELLFAVCERHFGALDEAMQQAAVGCDSAAERLYHRGRAYIEFGLANPEHYRILFMGRPEIAPVGFMGDRLLRTAAFGHLSEDVQAAMDAGEIAGDDAYIVACGLWMTVHGITSLVIAKPDFPWPPIDQLIEHMLAAHGRGIFNR
ncbi:MAG: hypothetical protein QOG64_1124 [Acidimicrobiaceae bacterium]|nr:hypothetical protein [Acidimicrobiaceae bacterium]